MIFNPFTANEDILTSFGIVVEEAWRNSAKVDAAKNFSKHFSQNLFLCFAALMHQKIVKLRYEFLKDFEKFLVKVHMTNVMIIEDSLC